MENLEFKQFEKMVMPIYREKFAQRLRQSMRDSGTKQVDLVERTGIDKSKISCYCAGKYMPKSEGLYLLAQALDVDVAWLMGVDMGEDEIKPRKLPIVGNIAAGLPIFAEENLEGYDYAPLSYTLEGRNYFFLRVRGDSMNLKFNDGDLILVQQQKYLDDGEIGVFLIDGESATVKKYRRDNNLVILEPMSNNPENTTQIYDLKKVKVDILGKVISYMSKV